MNWAFSLWMRRRTVPAIPALLMLFASPVWGGDSACLNRTDERTVVDLALRAAPASGVKAKTPAMDCWTSPDKFDHLLVSAVLSGGVFLSLNVTRNDEDFSLVSSVGGVVAFGAFKEIYDAYHPRQQSSWKDLAADALGALLGALITRSL
jgi:uncharacterized protein YfiM (DUF2279 family)